MKFPGTCLKKALAPATAMAMTLAVLLGCGKSAPPKPAVPAKPAASIVKTNTPGAMATANAEFVSVFDDRTPPENRGKDPFYPDSTRRDPKPPPTAPNVIAAHVDPVIKLLGVAGGPGRWLAAINNQILAAGEDSPVRLPDGSKINIHVVEIGQDYAVITVEGQPGQKRLTMEQKK